MRVSVTTAIVLVSALPIKALEPSPFAVRVIDHSPAPGQFVNHPDFNDPTEALGPPNGFGLAAGNNATVVTLGGFGGYIVLAFDHTVQDDPLNPLGLDAIVYGNAFWVGNPSRHWAECATIEVSFDANDNGESDDLWYLISGSHIDNLKLQWQWRTWDDAVSDPIYPPSSQLWIPAGQGGVWQTATWLLPADVFGPTVVGNSGGSEYEAVFGYADYSPTLLIGDTNADNIVDDPLITAEEFYTKPDDPWTTGITPRSGGGDAFDIAWAIDAESGEPANLAGFDFIRITTATESLFPDVGEKSAEIDAVADAARDPFGDMDDDGDIDLMDVAEFAICFGSSIAGTDPCDRADRQPDATIDSSDVAAFTKRMTGPKA